MVEKLGTIPRRIIAKDFKEVDSTGRFQIKKLGVWLGATSLYIPVLLKPAPAQLRLLLWALFNDQERLPEIPPAGICTIKVDKKASRVFYEVTGYRVVGENAVRLDMLERLANAAREVSMKGPFPMDPDLMSLVGTSGADFIEIMKYLGYVTREYDAAEAAEILAQRPKYRKEKSIEEEKNNSDKDSETNEVKEENKNSKKTEDTPKDNPDTETVVEEKPVEKVLIFTHKPESARRRPPMKSHKGKKKRFKNQKNSQKKGPIKHVSQAPKEVAQLDPDSPFAALAGLKEQLKGKK